MRKYSERFIKQTSILKLSKIGFEFEFYMKELSYYKTLEILNQILSPVKVWGFRKYHSDFEPDEKNFKLEPDLSLGSNGCELITGPLDYFTAKYYLVKIIKFINDYGYTNSKAAIHFNLSFLSGSEKNLNNLDILKLILQTDEDEIYRAFPARKDNVYAKSIKKIIPFKEYDYSDISIETVKNNLRLPSDKYYGINFLHINKPSKNQRIEYRYIGGKEYPQNTGRLLYFLDKFILDTYNSISSTYTLEDRRSLDTYLSSNINQMKFFSTYNSFITQYPSIVLQIDQMNNYDIVSSYYSKIHDKIYTLIDCTKNLENCIINFLTKSQEIELVDANVSATQNIERISFVNCTINQAIVKDCNIINSVASNCQLIESKVWGSEVKDSKILNTDCESSHLVNSFFMGGFLDCRMTGGVFRSGKLGSNSQISEQTKIISSDDNFFNTDFDDDMMDKSKKLSNEVSIFKKSP